MEMLKSWAVNIAAACLVCAVIDFFSPDGGIQRSVKFIISVFMVLMFVSPLKDIDFSVPEYTEGVEGFVSEYEYENQLEQQVADSLSAQIKGEIAAYLKEKAMDEHEIEVGINIDSKKNISIERVKIGLALKDMDKAQEIEAFIQHKFEFKPHIYMLGDGK